MVSKISGATASRFQRTLTSPAAVELWTGSEIHDHPAFRLRQNRLACSLSTKSRLRSTNRVIGAAHKGVNLSALVCRQRPVLF